MADTGENTADIKAHLDTWNGFTALMKWGTVGVAIIVAIVVSLLAH